MQSKNLVFNNTYDIVSKLGGGLTAEVYLAQNIQNPKEKVALKIYKQDFLQMA